MVPWFHDLGLRVACLGAVYVFVVAAQVFVHIPLEWRTATVVVVPDRLGDTTLEMQLGLWRFCSTVSVGEADVVECGFVSFSSCGVAFVDDPRLPDGAPDGTVEMDACSSYDAARIFASFAAASSLGLVLLLRRYRIVPLAPVAALTFVNLLSSVVVIGTWADNAHIPYRETASSLGYAYYVFVAVFPVSIVAVVAHVALTVAVASGKADPTAGGGAPVSLAERESREARAATRRPQYGAPRNF